MIWYVVYPIEKVNGRDCHGDPIAAFLSEEVAGYYVKLVSQLSGQSFFVEKFEGITWGVACPMCGNEPESRG